MAFLIIDRLEPDLIQKDDLISMEFKQTIYKYNKNGTLDISERLVPTHPCKEEDIANFYPVNVKQKKIESLLTSFTCIDHTDLQIQGSYNDQEFSYPHA